MSNAALVLFSAGQDSATCLAWALERYGRVETVGFDYRQRHRVELDQRPVVRSAIADAFPQWADRLGPDHVLDLGVLNEVADSALTRDMEITVAASGLPSTFVPGRNLVFLTLAGALAYRRGIDVLVGGMCETDYSGYPDCRADTLAAQTEALALGLERPMVLETPLMHLTKGQTWALAAQIGGPALVDLIVEHSHTCYQGDRAHRHVWGYGCGVCPACELRAKGWADWTAAT
jgi:7-cyano-7-deazaguanine synthase